MFSAQDLTSSVFSNLLSWIFNLQNQTDSAIHHRKVTTPPSPPNFLVFSTTMETTMVRDINNPSRKGQNRWDPLGRIFHRRRIQEKKATLGYEEGKKVCFFLGARKDTDEWERERCYFGKEEMIQPENYGFKEREKTVIVSEWSSTMERFDDGEKKLIPLHLFSPSRKCNRWRQIKESRSEWEITGLFF